MSHLNDNSININKCTAAQPYVVNGLLWHITNVFKFFTLVSERVVAFQNCTAIASLRSAIAITPHPKKVDGRLFSVPSFPPTAEVALTACHIGFAKHHSSLSIGSSISRQYRSNLHSFIQYLPPKPTPYYFCFALAFLPPKQ